MYSGSPVPHSGDGRLVEMPEPWLLPHHVYSERLPRTYLLATRKKTLMSITSLFSINLVELRPHYVPYQCWFSKIVISDSQWREWKLIWDHVSGYYGLLRNWGDKVAFSDPQHQVTENVDIHLTTDAIWRHVRMHILKLPIKGCHFCDFVGLINGSNL